MKLVYITCILLCYIFCIIIKLAFKTHLYNLETCHIRNLHYGECRTNPASDYSGQTHQTPFQSTRKVACNAYEESEHEFGQFYRLIWRIYFPGEDVCQFESGVPCRTIVAVVHRGKWLKVRVQNPVVAGVTVEVDNQVPGGVLGVRLLRPAADLGLQVSEGARPSVVDADCAVLEWAVLSPWTGGQSLWRECCWYRVLRVPVTQVLWIYRTCPLVWSKGCVILWHAIHASFWPINK